MKYQVWFGQWVAVCVGFHISVGVVVGDVFVVSLLLMLLLKLLLLLMSFNYDHDVGLNIFIL